MIFLIIDLVTAGLSLAKACECLTNQRLIARQKPSSGNRKLVAAKIRCIAFRECDMRKLSGRFAGLKSLFSWGSLCLIVLGGLIVVGSKAAIDQTNTIEFCISCHEMKDNNFEEYKTTIHAQNRTGVKATCSDCHVPHGFVDTAIRKIKASNDVFQHFAGTIDTKEKFEAHRLELAKRVWLRMKESDSRECRNCHDAASMDPEKQGKTAQKQHKKMATGERTCIDCHFGIAHKEPAGGAEPRDVLEK